MAFVSAVTRTFSVSCGAGSFTQPGGGLCGCCYAASLAYHTARLHITGYRSIERGMETGARVSGYAGKSDLTRSANRGIKHQIVYR